MAVNRNVQSERAGMQNQQGIFLNNYGGLNTTASDLNCPFGDSPLLYNVDIDISGKLTKRKGTKLIQNIVSSAANTTGYGLIAFTTGLRYDFLIEKIKKDINIIYLDDDTVTTVITKSNVFDENGGRQKPNYTRTTEIEPRVIICTGVNQPVQLRWVERQEVSTSASTTIAIENAERFEHSTTANTVFFINRVRTVPTNVSYSSGTLTVTFADTLAVDDVVDCIMVTWQHMIEALYLTGDRISQQKSRFHVVKTDQSVEIPSRIRFNPIYNYPTSEFEYGFKVYQSSQWNDTYTFDPTLTPVTSDEYAFGNGARYDSTAGGEVSPAPLFTTFGDIIGTGTSDPTEVFFIRRHDLNPWFNGGVNLPGSSLKVFSDDTLLTQSIVSGSSTSTYRSYWLIDDSNSIATSTSTVCRFITWESSAQIGIEEDAQVSILHVSTDHIGTSATTDVENYKDGACEPLYGIGAYFDYNLGSFANNVTIYEDRLIFSGIPSNPLKVLISELADSTIPLRPYRNFQIESLDNLATDPFDVNITSSADDYVTGLINWQSSLVIFTRQKVVRIYYSPETGFSPTSYAFSVISSQGLVNSYSVALGSNLVYYLTDVGVFTLTLGVDSQDYQGLEVSEKIRNQFGITSSPEYETQSFITYDDVNEKLYVGLPTQGETKYATRLYVYSVYRQAWTQYITDINFRIYHLVQYKDNTIGKKIIAACSLASDSKKGLLQFENDKFLDFYTESIADGIDTDFTLDVGLATVSYTTTDKLYVYQTDDITQAGAFRLFDSTEVNDTYVTLDGIELEFGVDYVKHRNNEIYLLNNPGSGKTLIINHRMPMTDYEVTQARYGISTPIANHRPVHVEVDNAVRFQEQDYTVSSSTSTTVSLLTAPAENAVVTLGMYYPVLYKSPLLTLDTFDVSKRIKHLYVYFDNELGLDSYTASDVNTASGQDPDEIIERPKQRLNANLLIYIDADHSADTQTDVYGFYSVVFDDSLFDVSPSTGQFRRYTLFKEHLLGVGYSYNLGVWSYDESSFTLAGWQITTRVNADRVINIQNG